MFASIRILPKFLVSIKNFSVVFTVILSNNFDESLSSLKPESEMSFEFDFFWIDNATVNVS